MNQQESTAFQWNLPAVWGDFPYMFSLKIKKQEFTTTYSFIVSNYIFIQG